MSKTKEAAAAPNCAIHALNGQRDCIALWSPALALGIVRDAIARSIHFDKALSLNSKKVRAAPAVHLAVSTVFGIDGRSGRCAVHGSNKTYPTVSNPDYITIMSFTLAPHRYALSQAVALCDRVLGQDRLYLRPDFVRHVVAARMRAGIRVLESFLRRLLILMALELEHELVVVERPENLARAQAVKPPRLKKPFLKIYPRPDRPFDGSFVQKSYENRQRAIVPSFDDPIITSAPVMVSIDRWLEKLDYLRAIAENPIAKARRLAFSLARTRHGILMAPPEPRQKVRRWGLEISSIHDALAYQIIEKSRTRPPPLPAPRRGPKPTITVFW